MTNPVNIGIVGCGNISSIYLKNCTRFPSLRVLACADLVLERAQAQATAFGVPKAYSVDELMADPAIELVLNLTIPAVHGEIGLAALQAGKHVYNEKPLAIERESARQMLELAESRGLRVGCAPDTFMGGGLQTCRKLIDQGLIGRPVAAQAFMQSRGPESWHPSPDFFYQPGAGPMFDMGPYYLTTLTMLLGPVRRVTGSAQISHPQRVIGSQPLQGTIITVNTPTHIAGVLDFQSGAVGTIVTSFDVHPGKIKGIEVFGTEGTMILPDPNAFGGPVIVYRPGELDWQEQPIEHTHVENSRGIGVADMADAIRNGQPHRANGELAFHVLDIMHAIHDASREGRHIELQSTMERPAALPTGWSALEAHAA
ncbi:MAG: oxidoreductase [Chloroflexi bacterium]|nr:MAG: oxidoreductase [Chloroflexota bacterium]